jgi:8-oxo-dGTP pyrophosphatase MutT (NUDIX family)
MSDWQTESSEVVYKTAWFKIHKDRVRNHNDKLLTYSYMELAAPTVTIVAVNAEGKVLLHRNYRYPVKKYLWEVPAGHSDGQDLLVAAKRELMEETGLASEDWTELGRLYSATGVANIERHVFLARNVRPADGERDKDEEITDQAFFSLEEINEMLRSGQLESSGAISALYLAQVHGLKEEN